MVDAVIHHWQHEHPNTGETIIFHADDGTMLRVAGIDAEQLQESLGGRQPKGDGIFLQSDHSGRTIVRF